MCHQKGYLLDNYLYEAFVKNGFNNWKRLVSVSPNMKSPTAIVSLFIKIHQMKASAGIGAQLDQQIKENQQLHRKLLLKQLSSLRYLARQGLAVRGHEQIEGNLIQLLLLRSEDCSELKQWIKEKHYLSSEILNEMLSLMCRTITMQLLKEIHEASIYSLIADEATDITNKEQLCISIRWVDPFCVIHEDALELTALTKTDSETIANAIKKFLLQYQLPISKCRCQAYDGASNMSGIIKGVATRIQNEEASAVYVHCLAHSLNLCLQTLAKCVTPIKEALDITMELGKFIDLSPKRSQLMSTLKAQLSPECQTPSIKMLCPTRWTVRTKALEAIIKSYKISIN